MHFHGTTMSTKQQTSLLWVFVYALVLFLVFAIPEHAHGATLSVSPETGVYTAESTFTVSVVVNTEGKPINAADASLSFNPNELSVVSVGKNGSVFTLWTLEPTFSNAAGTISFGGGSPSGYTGVRGTLITVTLRAKGAGTPALTMKSGSVLAADGLGTNVLTGMRSGNFTIEARTATPPPEYVPQPNTPSAPNVVSRTHPDERAWYDVKTAVVSWEVLSGVTAVRTLLDRAKTSTPTLVYDDPIRTRELTNLEEGTSYFHIQFKNSDGWGRVTHYALNVDTEAPKNLVLREKEGIDTTSTNRVFVVDVEDSSPLTRYRVQLDGGEPVEYTNLTPAREFELTDLAPGHHTIVLEAFDSVGKSAIASYAFDVEAIESPVFTEYPERLGEGILPALRGKAVPGGEVTVTIRTDGVAVDTVTVPVDENGVFTAIPLKPLAIGVYDVTALVRTDTGVSAPSLPVRIIVEVPGFMKFGGYVVNLLSVVVPLLALVFLLVFGSTYALYRFKRWKKRVQQETEEAEDLLTKEFASIVEDIHGTVEELTRMRKGKLTMKESALIEKLEAHISGARKRIAKEIEDIEDVVQ